jgi:hypothetical protein
MAARPGELADRPTIFTDGAPAPPVTSIATSKSFCRSIDVTKAHDMTLAGDASFNGGIFYVAELESLFAVLKPNRIIHKRMDPNYSSFHIRVFLGLSNPRDRGRPALYLYRMITLVKEELSLT